MTGLQIGSGQNLDLKSRCECLTTLFFYRLTLARVQRRKEIVEIAVAVICPMKLLTEAVQKPGLAKCFQIGVFWEIDVHRRNPSPLGDLNHRRDQLQPRLRWRARMQHHSWSGYGGERHRGEQLRVVSAAGAFEGVRPPVIEDIFSIGMSLCIKRDHTGDPSS